jgi:hypothetical protein
VIRTQDASGQPVHRIDFDADGLMLGVDFQNVTNGWSIEPGPDGFTATGPKGTKAYGYWQDFAGFIVTAETASEETGNTTLDSAVNAFTYAFKAKGIDPQKAVTWKPA